MRTVLLAGWALATLTGLGAAVAAPAGPPPQPIGLRAAPDTRAQALAQARAQFALLDRNRDGIVTRAELPVAPGGRVAFEALDTDHDGRISRAEFEAGRRARVHPLIPDTEMRVAGAAGPPPAPMGKGGMILAAMFDMADADHDGRLTRAEAEFAALARFDRADANHDGRLDDTEKAAFRPRMWSRPIDSVTIDTRRQ